MTATAKCATRRRRRPVPRFPAAHNGELPAVSTAVGVFAAGDGSVVPVVGEYPGQWLRDVEDTGIAMPRRRR